MKNFSFINKIERNENDERPLYVLIYEKLFDLIKNGYFQSGQKLPGEHTLAENMGVSRGSLRQALLILQEDGIIYNHQGKGNFISNNNTLFGLGLEKKGNILELVSNKEIQLSEDIEVYFESPNKMLQDELNIKATQIILVVKRVYTINEDPISYIISFIPYGNIEKDKIDIEEKRNVVKYSDNNLYQMVSNSKAEFLYTKAGGFIADRLKVEEESPLILIEENLFEKNGQVLAFLKQYFIPEYCSFYINRK